MHQKGFHLDVNNSFHLGVNNLYGKPVVFYNA